MNDSIERIAALIRDKSVVLWVGAGFSRAAGFPDSKGLAGCLIKHFFEDVEERKKLYKRKNDLQYITSAIVNKNECRTENENQLYEYLANIYTKKKIGNSAHRIVRDIPQLENIITTNYDNAFELTFENDIDVIYNNDSYLSAAISKTKLYKIHGDFRDKTSVILTGDNYVDFFIKQENNLMLNPIKHLIACKSIVFVGYSCSDINIIAMIKKVREISGNNKKTFYIVSPQFDEYRRQELNILGFEFIYLTGEEFFKKVDKCIRDKFIEDMEVEKIDHKTAIEVTRRNGFIPLMVSSDGHLKTKSIKVLKKDVLIEGVMSLEGDKSFFDKFNDFITGRNVGELFVSGENIKHIRTQIQGYTLDDSENVNYFILATTPKYDGIGFLFLDESIKKEQAKVKWYVTRYVAKLEIKLPYMFIEVNLLRQDHNMNATVNYHARYNHWHQALDDNGNILRFLNTKKVYLEIPNHIEKCPFLSNDLSQKNEADHIRKKIIEAIDTLSALIKIQEHFKVNFDIQKYKKEGADPQKIILISKALNNETVLSSSGILYYQQGIEDYPDQLHINQFTSINEDGEKREFYKMQGYSFSLVNLRIAPCNLFKDGFKKNKNEQNCCVYTNESRRIPLFCDVICERIQ